MELRRDIDDLRSVLLSLQGLQRELLRHQADRRGQCVAVSGRLQQRSQQQTSTHHQERRITSTA